MPRVNRDALHGFLQANAVSQDMVPAAMEKMEPFFARAESGVYIFGETPTKSAVKKVIAGVTGIEPVRRIEFFSVLRPIPEPGWITREIYENSLRSSLAACFWASLGTSLGDVLADSNRVCLWDRLGDRLRDRLGYTFSSSLESSLRCSLAASHESAIREVLSGSLFHYLGFVLLGDEELVARFTPLIELLPYAMPLGMKKGEPTTWLVLCA